MSESESKRRKRHFDRVTLQSETLDRLDAWIKQAQSIKPGVVLFRKDVLNWLIMDLPEHLSPVQAKSLADAFYSELRFIQFATREIKAAAARGEQLTLRDLESRMQTVKTKRQRRNKKLSSPNGRIESDTVEGDTPRAVSNP